MNDSLASGRSDPADDPGALVAGVRRGDEDSCARLYHRYGGMVHGILLAITLWHLVSRLHGDPRTRVIERLAELVPLPSSQLAAVTAGDERYREVWLLEILSRLDPAAGGSILSNKTR